MIQNQFLTLFTKLALLLMLLLASAQTQAKHILIYGDSLSAGYGLEPEQNWVYLLSQSLENDQTISNASISGETSGGGLARLNITLEELKPDVVMIALGANDGLRGYSNQQLKKNLSKMVTLVKNTGAQAIMAGVTIPPSFGPRYIDEFRAVFPAVAEEQQIPYIDFFQEEFFTIPGYLQADGLHPTAMTQAMIRDRIKAFFETHNLLE